MMRSVAVAVALGVGLGAAAARAQDPPAPEPPALPAPEPPATPASEPPATPAPEPSAAAPAQEPPVPAPPAAGAARTAPPGEVLVLVPVPPPPRPPPEPPPEPPPAAPPCPPCSPEPKEDWADHYGARLTGGLALTEDVALGAFGRLEMEAYGLRAPEESWIGGGLIGFEGWGSEDGGGGGIPMVWFAGFREDTSVFATLGIGWSWAIYDRIRGDGGFGIFAPLATAAFGVDLEGVRILADGRAQYRWQWGADDHYQLLAGLSFSVTSDH